MDIDDMKLIIIIRHHISWIFIYVIYVIAKAKTQTGMIRNSTFFIYSFSEREIIGRIIKSRAT